jgi:flagellar protein FlgJ
VSSVESLFGPGFAGATDRVKLQRAAQEMEAVVLTQLLGAMRSTVPESDLFGQSLSNDVFQSMLDQELARVTAERSPFGLAESLLQSLEKHVKQPEEPTEAPEGEKTPDGARFRRIG